MTSLSLDEKVNLLITRWNRIDMPSRFRWCWRIRPYRWMATAGIHRYLDHIGGVKRTDVDTFHGWSIRALWLEVWWYRR